MFQLPKMNKFKNSHTHILFVVIILFFQSSCVSNNSTEIINNNAEQMYELGLQYGRNASAGKSLDLSKSVNYLQKAADQNYLPAIHALGWLYFNDRNTKDNLEKAEKYFRIAAQQGYSESQFMLGLFYAQGWVVEKNSNLSLQWIKKAADQGHTNAKKALMNLFGKVNMSHND